MLILLTIIALSWKVFIRVFHYPIRVLFNLVDRFVDALQRRKATGPDYFLTGNHGPVEKEVFAADLKVEGELPACLNGEFVRNGPNPKYAPRGLYHWFDGDGMLHGIRIRDGRVSYVNRYVRTQKLAEEDKLGHAFFIKIGDLQGKLGLLKLMWRAVAEFAGAIPKFDILQHGTNNTALEFHAGRLYALVESSLPYAVRVLADGQLETRAMQTYGGALKHPFTAHPKVDPVNGDMFFFGYELDKAPYCTYSVVDASGVLVRDVPIPLPEPVMMHDFAVTENYAIFMDLPLVFRKQTIVKGYPFVFDKKRPSRFGLLPRYASNTAELRWFSAAPGYIFHTANAWEEGEEVVLLACRYAVVDMNFATKSDNTMVPRWWEYRFNLSTGETKERQLGDARSTAEFPRVAPAVLTRYSRYAYAAVADEINVGDAQRDVPFMSGVVKLDIETGETKTIVWGPGREGGECVFVPRHKQPAPTPSTPGHSRASSRLNAKSASTGDSGSGSPLDHSTLSSPASSVPASPGAPRDRDTNDVTPENEADDEVEGVNNPPAAKQRKGGQSSKSKAKARARLPAATSAPSLSRVPETTDAANEDDEEGKAAGFKSRKSLAGDEDDGFLMTFVYDSNTKSSEFIVMDAKTMSSKPVAVVKLPQRVPAGFHGIFVTEEQLASQTS